MDPYYASDEIWTAQEIHFQEMKQDLRCFPGLAISSLSLNLELLPGKNTSETAQDLFSLEIKTCSILLAGDLKTADGLYYCRAKIILHFKSVFMYLFINLT